MNLRHAVLPVALLLLSLVAPSQLLKTGALRDLDPCVEQVIARRAGWERQPSILESSRTRSSSALSNHIPWHCGHSSRFMKSMLNLIISAPQLGQP